MTSDCGFNATHRSPVQQPTVLGVMQCTVVLIRPVVSQFLKATQNAHWARRCMWPVSVVPFAQFGQNATALNQMC
jgi:hypothetical protein